MNSLKMLCMLACGALTLAASLIMPSIYAQDESRPDGSLA